MIISVISTDIRSRSRSDKTRKFSNLRKSTLGEDDHDNSDQYSMEQHLESFEYDYEGFDRRSL
jgi:hypothetical protein